MPLSLKIGPSILSSDFGKLNEEIDSVDEHVDFIHADVMDGHFVPNITFGAPVVKYLKTRLPIECHLMIENPEKYVEDFAKALVERGTPIGEDMITIHVEATGDKTVDVLKQIRDLGVKPAISLNPPTDIAEIEPYLDLVDMVLVMTVNPGFGGQAFITECLSKIKRVRQLKPDLEICVDGGVKADTGQQCLDAGANMLVAGSYIFKAEDRLQSIQSLRNLKFQV